MIAAVSDVFPWSTCPIVPMFTCGFVRSNFSLAMLSPRLPARSSSRDSASLLRTSGAHDQNRTGDLVLTKDALCRLSYVGVLSFVQGVLRRTPWNPPRSAGVNPASLRARCFLLRARCFQSLFSPRVRPGSRRSPSLSAPTLGRLVRSGAGDGIRTRDIQLGRLELYQLSYTRLAPTSRAPSPRTSLRLGGEGRIRTFEGRGPSDLQSDAFDRFATSPPMSPDAPGFTLRARLQRGSGGGWSWRRELNPRPADYKSAALPLSYASDKR